MAVTSVDDGRSKVAQLLDDGADLITIMMESGRTFGRDIPVLSPDEASAIVEVARERGVPVSAHAMDSKDLARAPDASVDDIAHMVWDPLTDELINGMMEDGVFWVPTLELYHLIAKDAGNDWDQLTIENLRRFVEAGGQVALGTDFDGYGAEFNIGMPMIEIESMAAAGMTPMQIIVAATANAAYVCNLDAEIGTMESGKSADVLIVNGDPLKDLQALTRTLLILRDGVAVRQ